MGARHWRRVVRRTGLALGVATAVLPGPGTAQEFHVDRASERRVVFLSRASIEEFEGVTEALDGYVVLDGGGVRAGDSFDGSSLYFEVDLASIDTGIGLRNRHMRENYLEVDQHPFATFAGTVARIAPEDGGWRVVSTGTFAVHGVEQPRTLECLARPDGDGFQVSCGFVVNLTDHDIEIPRVMFLKLAEDIRLDLTFRLRPAPTRQEGP